MDTTMVTTIGLGHWAGSQTGAIIGGLPAQPRYYGPSYYDQSYYGPTYYRPHYYAPRNYRQVYYGGNTHTRWCYARYRSYRAYDNTFQPYYGPRRACVSPRLLISGVVRVAIRDRWRTKVGHRIDTLKESLGEGVIILVEQLFEDAPIAWHSAGWHTGFRDG